VNVIHALLGEHAVLNAELDHVERASDGLLGLDELRAQFELLAAGFREYARLRQDLVSETLAPRLSEDPITSDGHELLDGLLTHLACKEDLPEAQSLVGSTASALRGHLRSVEKTLFAAAQRELSDAELARLGADWARRRGVKIADQNGRLLDVIDGLMGEHGAFYVQLDYLQRLSQEGATPGRLKAFFTVIAAGLSSHAWMEEHLVFDVLERKFELRDTIHNEHEVIHTLLSQFAGLQDPSEVASLLSQTAQAVRRHFENEEKTLFPGARRVMEEARLVELGARWAEQRKVTV